ncbi:MAG: BrnT family toxin [Ruminiclostridium sp.]|nr:BrnT family toxin [Ruminiclostridium sp.]
MTFEWDENKEQINRQKHKIGFTAAIKVFKDENRVEVFDSKHSANEDRYLTIGSVDGKLMIITVIYTERENAVRLISARKATREEREFYYDN